MIRNIDLIILILLFLFYFISNIETFQNKNIDITQIPYDEGDEIFKSCVDELKKNNKIDKLELIKCTHKYCANMRSKSLDGGSIVTNLIPIESFDGKGETKNFYISVCCTSDYCRMIFNKSHKYKLVDGNYYLVKTNNNYGNKVVQLLFDENEDILKDGKHLSGLGGDLSLDKIKEICNL